MGWELDVLQGVASTASEIGSGIYNVLSSTPLNQFLVDNATLEALKQISGTEIAPIVNDIGETIGYVGRAASAANGSTAISNTWMTIARTAETVTQEMIDAAIPLVGGGSTADLEVGQEITKAALEAGSGVGAAAGTGFGSTAIATVAGPSIAVALGVAAGTALYNISPEFWTSVEQSLESAGKTIGGKVISFFKSDGTEYYDEETIEIIKQKLIDEGYLSSGDGFEQVSQVDGVPTVFSSLLRTKTIELSRQNNSYSQVLTTVSDFFWAPAKVGDYLYNNPISGTPGTKYYIYRNSSGYQTQTNTSTNSSYTHDGKTVYYSNAYTHSYPYDKYISPCMQGQQIMDGPTAWTLLYSSPSTPTPNELAKEDNGENKYVSPIPTTVADPLRTPSTSPDYSPTNYYDPNPTTTDVPDPSDAPTPQVDPTPQPSPEPSPDPHPVNPPTNPTNPTNPNPPTPGNEDTGDSPLPPAIIPMAASGVSKIFNPTQGEVDALGQYLWSSTNIEDILKLFQSPLDGIIALFKLYATPVTGEHQGIKLGYLPTGVSAAVVTRQVVTVDCGEIEIPLSKQNATDYPPYTTIQIYLPFIGIEPLNAYDLVGSRLACQYRVDCYTGACIAQLIVTRDNMVAKLYEFSGNCAQQIPLTSGNFLQLAGNIISGAITGAVHGGVVGAAIGAGSSLIHSNVEVGRSGNLSANAGMLGSRIPYIIITRAISADAANYSYFYGYPANKTVYLSNCRGYVRIKDIILHTSATEAEKAEIERLLKEGVYI